MANSRMAVKSMCVDLRIEIGKTVPIINDMARMNRMIITESNGLLLIFLV
jgi:hypothetical protein